MTRLTSDEIRKDSLDMTKLLANHQEPTPRLWFLLAQSLVMAVQECAAQLAEANERQDVVAGIKPLSTLTPYAVEDVKFRETYNPTCRFCGSEIEAGSMACGCKKSREVLKEGK